MLALFQLLCNQTLKALGQNSWLKLVYSNTNIFSLILAFCVSLTACLTPAYAADNAQAKTPAQIPAQTQAPAPAKAPNREVLKEYFVTTLPYEIQEVIWNYLPQEDGHPRLSSIRELKAKQVEIKNNANLTDEVRSTQLSAVRKEESMRNLYMNLLDKYDELRFAFKDSQKTLDQLQTQLEQAEIEYSKPPKNDEIINLSIDELNLFTARVAVKLDKVQTDLNNATAEYSSLQSLPTRAQNTFSKNNDRIFEIAKILGNNSPSISEYERNSLAVEAYVIRYENAVLEAHLYFLTFFQDKASYQISINTLHNDYLTNYLSYLREYQTQLVAKNLNNSNSNSNIDTYEQTPILEDEIKINNLYSATINKVTKRNALLKEELKTVETAINNIYQLEKNMQDQITNVSEGLILSRLLNNQQNEIPEINISFNPDELLTNITVALLELRVQREQLFGYKKYVNNMIEDNPQFEPYKEQLINIMRHRRDIINKLYQAQTESMSLCVNLRDKYREFKNTSSSVRSVIHDHLFWLTSNSGISLDFFINFIPNIKKQFLNFLSNYNNFDEAKASILHWLTGLIPILIVGFVFQRILPLVQSRINKLALVLDKPNDNYLATPLALILHWFMIVPFVARLTAFGSFIIFLVINDFRHQVLITLYLALHLMCFIFVRRVLELNSLAQRHFSFPIERNRYFRSILDKIWLVSIPMLLIANMRILESRGISQDQIGYTLMTLGFMYLTGLAFMTTKRRFERRTPTMAFWILGSLGVLTPLTLTIMLALGYYYTVVQLLNRVAISLYIFFLYYITSHTLRRELSVAEHRMIKQAKERMVDLSDQNTKSTSYMKNDVVLTHQDPLKDTLTYPRRGGNLLQTLRVDLVTTRSFKLFNSILLCLFVYLMYFQWNDLAGVLNYLDNIYLWTKTEIVNNKEIVVNHLSLGKFLLAILIIIATVILTKNLPNLLEKLFLLKANTNNKSTSYTVKIISTYLITTVGIIMSANMLGISWDNLQWLVAALSVGLGFGLQEIFGNFVAGIIILFERQLRVGDIVTLSSLTGTVRKIRIRATTIESFENKEVVIPNKQFITSALTNWSLSNTVTRIDFSVGIAYTADINKAKSLLRNILKGCKTLNRDRKPLIYVKSLDDGRATILCEVYVNEILKRKETYDYLSIETLRVFRENGIEVPFDQLEVTIHNLDTGKKLTETQTNIIKSAAVRSKKKLKEPIVDYSPDDRNTDGGGGE